MLTYLCNNYVVKFVLSESLSGQSFEFYFVLRIMICDCVHDLCAILIQVHDLCAILIQVHDLCAIRIQVLHVMLYVRFFLEFICYFNRQTDRPIDRQIKSGFRSTVFSHRFWLTWRHEWQLVYVSGCSAATNVVRLVCDRIICFVIIWMTDMLSSKSKSVLEP